jgi:hypothetical protein
MTNWHYVLQDKFDDFQHKQGDCSVPMKEIKTGEIIVARYVKFTAKTYYGDGAALQFLQLY